MIWLHGILGIATLGCAVGFAGAAPSATEAARSLAPSGHLRAAINFGNPVLARRDPQSGDPRGVSIELARELGRRLGVPVDFVLFNGAGQVFDALRDDRWDVAFLAIDPVRADQITFSAPYVLIEGTYLVPQASAFHTVDEVDRDGTRITVAANSAYDLYLTRALKHAQLVRFPSGQAADAMDAVRKGASDAAAGVKQPLVTYAQQHPEVRVIPGRFMMIEQAVGIPKAHEAGAAYVRTFVEEMKASGFVAKALAASGQTDASVAPAYP